MSIFLVNQFFYILLNKNKNKIDFLLNIKSIIVDKINDFIMYNLNINSVLNSIDLKLKNVPSSSRELRVIQIICYTKKLLRARYTQERHSITVLKAVRRP